MKTAVLWVVMVSVLHGLGRSGTAAEPPVARKPNGFRVRSIDCRQGQYQLILGPRFDSRKSWVLNCDFAISAFEDEQRCLFIWSDPRPGRDPIVLRLVGARLDGMICDARTNETQTISAPLGKDVFGRWVKAVLCYDAQKKVLELWLDGALAAMEKATLVPIADRPMPTYCERFEGRIREISLGNAP